MKVTVDSRTIKQLAYIAIALSIFILAAEIYWSFGTIKKLTHIANADYATAQSYSHLVAGLKSLSVVLAGQGLTLAGLGTVARVFLTRLNGNAGESSIVPSKGSKHPFIRSDIGIFLGSGLIGFVGFLWAMPIPGFEKLTFSQAHFDRLLLWHKGILGGLVCSAALITIPFAIWLKAWSGSAKSPVGQQRQA